MADPKHTAFMSTYQGCHDSFIRYCSALSYGKMETDDLVQDVLLSAYQNFDKIAKKDQLLHYLIRAARNRSISRWRRSKFKQELVEQHANRLRSKEVSPETLLDIQLLYQVLNQLPEKQKDALILFEISGFSMKEIAQIQDSTEGAVKTKISRGRKKLKELLAEKNRDFSSISNTLKSIAL